ncbi:alpha/beta fold hydrolase [Actinotalea sp.]|uniref:alpha/beta fold hydrolase n=1 Tax=Actinotalea sp. TaxID=1872145 RepID=UPI0035646979
MADAEAYATWGDGPRSLIFIPGGPGNAVASAFMLRMMLQPLLRPLVDDGYRVWVVTRRRNMPEGHSVADMAGDYAALIRDEFKGRVDLVIGLSYGGMITFHLAADHPACAEHFVAAGAAHEITDRGKDIDYRMALGVSAGDRIAAGMATGEYMLAGDRNRWLRRLLAPLLGRMMAGPQHEYYRHDVMVEAEAERAYSAADALPRIGVPMLLVCGDRDIFFPKEVVEEAARLTPQSTLLLYPGQGHIKASSNKRLGSDVLVYVKTRQAGRPDGQGAGNQ